MSWWKAVIVAVLTLGVGGIAASGLMSRPPPAVEVQIARVRKGPITRTISGAGKVQSATTVRISSNISGDLTERLVQVGDRVTKGQVLGRIDRRRFEAAAKQALAGQSAARAEVQVAQVEVDRATAERGRVESLVRTGMASGADLDQARAAHETAQARLVSARERLAQAGAQYEEAQNQLSKTTLLSPIDGTVIETSREVGERVLGSDFFEDVVMTIGTLSAMEVRIEVSEHAVVYLAAGQKAEVFVDAIEGKRFPGTVSKIAKKALIKNPGTEAEVTSFPVTVALDVHHPAVLTGMSAEVRIATESRAETLLVPAAAVTVRAEDSLPDARPPSEEGFALSSPHDSETLAKVVFVVDGDGRVHPRRVKTGISSDTDFEILEGLKEGEQVVEGPYRVLNKDLKDGDAVRPVEAQRRSAQDRRAEVER
jgi:HlyD family secretion protein